MLTKFRNMTDKLIKNRKLNLGILVLEFKEQKLVRNYSSPLDNDYTYDVFTNMFNSFGYPYSS